MIKRLWRRLAAVAALALLAGCGGQETSAPAGATPQDAQPERPAPQGTPEITAEDLRRHIAVLASDEYEGRAPMTPGGTKTRHYIANEYKRLGVEPLGDSYFHNVPMVEATLDTAQSRFSVTTPAGARDLRYGADIVYWTKRVVEDVAFDSSDMVFVGYGVVAPEHGWNDYEGVDARGKTVVMLVNDPGFLIGDATLFNGDAMTYYGRWTYKYEEAARQGAAAALIVHDTRPAAYGWGVVEGSWSGAQVDLKRADEGASRVIAEGWLSNEAARAIFDETGLDFDALQDAANRRGFRAVAMAGATTSARLATSIKYSEDANVIGVLRGTEAPDEYVLYMGHWDHLGVNPNAEGDDKIFNGAVDNATGIAAILEIAEKFAAAAERPRRSILFAAVTAEESGLLGSAYMAEDPPVPLKQIVGGINIDAILPTPPVKDMVVVGYGASELEDILERAAAARGRYLTPDPEPEKGYFYRSDHISFAKKGVPMLYADGGVDLVDGGKEAGAALGEDYRVNRYHKPADEYDESWPMVAMVDTVKILYEVGETLASSDGWPNWREGNEFRALRDAQRAGE